MQGIRMVIACFGVSALFSVPPVQDVAAGVPEDAFGTGAAPAAVAINEFAPRGRGATDEFLELRNTSNQAVSLGGWELWTCMSLGSPILVAVFSSSDVIDPGGYMLLAHVNSSGTGPADHPYDGWDIPDDGGWLLSDPWSGQFDGVGLRPGADCTEGDPAPTCDWAAGEAIARDKQGEDTDDNAVDFTCQARTPGW